MLPPELVALLEKCTINRGEELVCPLCGSTSVNKNGKKDGRQIYLCKACVKTFGDTYGTLLYHSKLTVKQWIEFLTLGVALLIGYRTEDRVNMLLDMLTKGVPAKVEFQKLKYRPFPFDTKNVVRVVTNSA